MPFSKTWSYNEYALQMRLANPLLPSTRLAMRLPSLGFHFSPACYHRLMQVAKIFQGENRDNADLYRPWDQADFEGWLSVLTWKVADIQTIVFFLLLASYFIRESPNRPLVLD